MGTIDESTSLVPIGAFMIVVGIGIAMLIQNLILAVQNAIPLEEIGAGSALIVFFRGLGGVIGVSSSLSASGGNGAAGGRVPDLSILPDSVRDSVEHAYGTGVAEIFLVAAPMGIAAFIALWFLRGRMLATRSGIELSGGQERAR